MLDEQNVGALMHEEASAVAPESTVDIGRAVRVGRRRRRVRLAASGSVAALTALAVVGGVAAVHGLARAGRPDQRLPAGQTASPARPAAPAAFDPMVRTVDAGYLPSGLDGRLYSVSSASQVLSYVHYGRPGSAASQIAEREVDVAVFTPGGVNRSQSWWLRQEMKQPTATTSPSDGPVATPASPTSTTDPTSPDVGTTPPTASTAPGDATPSAEPARAGGDLPDGEPGPRVAGGPSYWQVSLFDTADEAVLAWHWAPGAWAYVRVLGYGDQASARPVAARVAAAVRTGLRQPVALPFTVQRPPAQLSLRQTQVYWNGTDFGATLSFARDASLTASGEVPQQLLISSQTVPERTGADEKYAPPNMTIAGHKAYVGFDESGDPARTGTGVIDLYAESGQMFTIAVYDAATARYVNLKQAMALAASMTVVPGATDQANWTTDPLK